MHCTKTEDVVFTVDENKLDFDHTRGIIHDVHNGHGPVTSLRQHGQQSDI